MAQSDLNDTDKLHQLTRIKRGCNESGEFIWIREAVGAIYEKIAKAKISNQYS